MDDALGFRFAVIGASAVVDGVSAATREAWDCFDTTVLTDAGEEVDEWLSSLEASAVILRPDRYILGVASSSADLDAITAEARRFLICEEVAATS
jgi:3-(3-hydroxy-phenyl)propionate hydroxylase